MHRVLDRICDWNGGRRDADGDRCHIGGCIIEHFSFLDEKEEEGKMLQNFYMTSFSEDPTLISRNPCPILSMLVMTAGPSAASLENGANGGGSLQ